jgi:hypothetical protein
VAGDFRSPSDNDVSTHSKPVLGVCCGGRFRRPHAAGLSARADELVQNMGPVGPNELILTTVGNKRVVAFYVPDGGYCGINVVVWDNTDEVGNSAARVRISLDPRQMVHIDSADNKSINLQCGDYADTLALVDTSKLTAAGAAE